MRGRTPKPTSLKALQGHAGHRPKAHTAGKEPAPPSGVPEPPPHLDDTARRKWYERLGVMTQVAGWMTLFDGDVLAAYCSSYARWQEAEEKMPLLRRKLAQARGKARGLLLNDLNTMLGQHRQAMKDMKSFGAEIGWSSASRTRIRINDGQILLPGLGGAPAPRQAETPFEKASRLAGA